MRVSQVAHHHKIDIDPTKEMQSQEWDRVANVCISRAATALKGNAPGYSKEQRDQLGDLFTSMAATSRTIRRVLEPGSHEPGTVDALALVRLQLEGLYALCLMLENPDYVTCYVQDYWKKRYVDYLLAFEETRALPRFTTMKPSVPSALQQLAALFGVTDAQAYTVAHEELGHPLPPGVSAQAIQPFPTPRKAISKIAPGSKRRMLERLHLKYVDLCSFAHGLARANLFKNVFDSRSPHRYVGSDAQIEERFQYDVLGEAYTLNFLSIAQSTAELTQLYPNDMELPAAAVNAWNSLCQASLLTKAIWEIRTKSLLGVI
jgi:hypothetical protein